MRFCNDMFGDLGEYSPPSLCSQGWEIAAGAIASAVIGGVMSNMGGAARNAANQRMSDQQMAFQLNSAIQDQGFQNEQAVNQRNWQEGQTHQMMDFNFNEARRQEAFQRQMVSEAYDYQTRMSNSAYQRAMQDMRSAGLNPILAYAQGGASTPIGQIAAGSARSAPSGGAGAAAHGVGSLPGARADMVDTIGSAANTAMRAGEMVGGLAELIERVERIGAEVKNIDADTDLKRAATLTEAKRTGLTSEQTLNTAADTLLKKVQQGYTETGTALNVARTGQAEAEAGRATSESRLARERAAYEPTESWTRGQRNISGANLTFQQQRQVEQAIGVNTPEAQAAQNRAGAFRDVVEGFANLMKFFKGR